MEEHHRTRLEALPNLEIAAEQPAAASNEDLAARRIGITASKWHGRNEQSRRTYADLLGRLLSRILEPGFLEVMQWA